MKSIVLLLVVLIAAETSAKAQTHEEAVGKSIEKGIAYLAAETPTWRTEHRCASCHHQGNAVRALLSARAKGELKDDRILDNSLDWLEQPEKWANNHGDPNASDQALAELQFGATLLAAERVFPERFSKPLEILAKMLAARQSEDGHFALDNSEGLPTPITLGPILLTGEARRVFNRQGEAFDGHAKRAKEWLEKKTPRNTIEASSLLLVLEAPSKQPRKFAKELLLKSAHADGGFGPYPDSPAEVFDTSLALIALSREREPAADRTLITRAVNRLIRWQQADGSWDETTRPAGSISYAHRIATSAWAVEALLEYASVKD